MDKTFAAIEKLKEVELELHRLKNYAEMMNRSVEAQREWKGLTDEEIGMLTVFDGLHHVEIPLLAEFIRAIEAKLKEKNA
jgi:hypothetical protein